VRQNLVSGKAELRQVKSEAGMAVGVAYTSIEGCQRKFFRCSAYGCTMSTEACAGRFQAAQTAKDEALFPIEKCRQCAIGAVHAGTSVVHRSRIFERKICPRCLKGTTRIIGGRRCVSCYNREREMRIGRNRKGTPLVRVRPLHPVSIGYSVDGIYNELVTMAVDRVEAVAHIIRTKTGSIFFSRPCGHALATGGALQ
jgi:hypothetical protein